jgi:hypothetical protein
MTQPFKSRELCRSTSSIVISRGK